MQNRFCGVALLLLALVFTSSASGNHMHPVVNGKDQLVLGVLPIVSPTRLEVRFAPLVRHLSSELDFEITLETAPNFKEFARRSVEEQRYDFLFTAPHFYYLAQRNSGYRVVVRVDGLPLDAVIVTRRDSAIAKLDDLRGRTLATPDSLSLATLLTRELLAHSGEYLEAAVTLVETPTHNASLQSAINGWTDAASVINPVFRRMAPDVRAQLRVLATTGNTPHMPFSAAPWVAKERAQAFADAMLAIENTESGRALLAHLGWPGFAAAQPKDYDEFHGFVAAIGGR